MLTEHSAFYSLSRNATASQDQYTMRVTNHFPPAQCPLSPKKQISMSGDITPSWFLLLTLQQLGVYEQLQRQQQHHQNDTGHQETVEACRQQTDLPQRCPSPAARLQPVRPDQQRERETEMGVGGTPVRNAVGTKINGRSCCSVILKCNTGAECGSDRQQPRSNQ